jgi:hypothetical protein
MFSSKGEEPIFSKRVAHVTSECSDIESAMISVVESAVNCAIRTTFVFKTNKNGGYFIMFN